MFLPHLVEKKNSSGIREGLNKMDEKNVCMDGRVFTLYNNSDIFQFPRLNVFLKSSDRPAGGSASA